MGFYPALIFFYEIGLHIIGSNGWSTTKRFREARVYWRSSHIYHSLELPFSPKYKEWLGFIEYRYLSALNTYNTYFHTLSMQQNELLKTVLKGTLREKLLSHLQRKKGLPFFQNKIQVWLLYSIHLGNLTNCWKWFSSIGENIQYWLWLYCNFCSWS